MENFTMMLEYDPKVTYTRLYQKSTGITHFYKVAKEDNTMVFQEVCVL